MQTAGSDAVYTHTTFLGAAFLTTFLGAAFLTTFLTTFFGAAFFTAFFACVGKQNGVVQ